MYQKETYTGQYTFYFIEYADLSRKVKIILTISKCQPANTVVRFGACSAATQRELASIVRNDMQDDRFYSAGLRKWFLISCVRLVCFTKYEVC